MRTVIASGGFDPLHSGHIDYFNEAAKLGERLWVALNSDEWLTRKKGQPFMCYAERLKIISNLRMVDRVIPVVNDHKFDNSSGAILWAQQCGAKDIVFVNGGDRTDMNSPEEDFYQHDTGVRFVYGVGGETKKNSSRWLLQDWALPKTDRKWGYYRVLKDYGPEVKLKELVVNPHDRLSMQRHSKRSEHWFVAEGIATIYTISEASSDIELVTKKHKFESIHVGMNGWHMLANEESDILRIIEIQYGEECVEEDIERKD